MGFWDKVHNSCVQLAGGIFSALDCIVLLLKKIIIFSKTNKRIFNNIETALFVVGVAFVILGSRFNLWKNIGIILILVAILINAIMVWLPSFILYARISVLTNLVLLFFIDNLVTCFIFVVFSWLFKTQLSLTTYVVIYGCLWVIFSLFAEEKVAKLANEIVSGFSVLIFTISTYCISLTTNEAIFSTLLKFSTERPWLAPESLKALADLPWTQFFLLIPGGLLVFISLSCFSIMLVSLKQYWKDKYGFCKPAALQKI